MPLRLNINDLIEKVKGSIEENCDDRGIWVNTKRGYQLRKWSAFRKEDLTAIDREISLKGKQIRVKPALILDIPIRKGRPRVLYLDDSESYITFGLNRDGDFIASPQKTVERAGRGKKESL